MRVSHRIVKCDAGFWVTVTVQLFTLSALPKAGTAARREWSIAKACARLSYVIRLTCAATTFQPSAKRTQVWDWRPVRSLPGRLNSILATP